MCTSKSHRKSQNCWKNKQTNKWVEMGEKSREEGCIWYSRDSEEISNRNGRERLQRFTEKGSDEKIASKGQKREKCKGSVCTSKLALGSKKPIPFNRACMFTKRLGPSNHIVCEHASGLLLQSGYTIMHEIQWSVFPRSDFM